MLALVLPVCFEINFILNIWLGKNMPPNTPIFAVLVLCTYLMETYHQASLMSYHAIGKIKLGNIVGGTLMICALPLSYVALRFGAPAYSVFIVIFCVNFTQMFWGWMIVHRYVKYSYAELIKRVYIPTVSITLISILVPVLLTQFMEQGWIRLIVLGLATETILLVSTYLLALDKVERAMVYDLIRKKILKK